MPRLTGEISEIEKLAKLPSFLEKYGLKNCRVFLTNSSVHLEGLVLPASTGNNGGEGGRWQYRGSIAIRTPDEDIEVDFLDVDRAELV